MVLRVGMDKYMSAEHHYLQIGTLLTAVDLTVNKMTSTDDSGRSLSGLSSLTWTIVAYSATDMDMIH